MSLKPDDLIPYPTYILARLESGIPARKLLDALADDLDIQPTSDRRRTQAPVVKTDKGLTCAYLTYARKVKPTWLRTSEPGFDDLRHHILLLAQFEDLVAFYSSEPAALSRISRLVLADSLDDDSSPLGQLSRIDPDLLNGAFLTGPAKTLWLTGVHRRTSVKADSKVLAGSRLQDALSPLGDQSYMFTAARGSAALIGLPSNRPELAVGVVPRKSRLWTAPTDTWASYRDTTIALLRKILESDSTSMRTSSPIPVLAAEVHGVTGVSRAYDLCVVPPELLDPTEGESLAEDDIATLTRWSSEAHFLVTPQSDAKVKATAVLFGDPVATLDIAWVEDKPGALAMNVAVTTLAAGTDADAQQLRSLCKRRGALTVYFESGHTYSDGHMFAMRYRDIAFNGWRFQAFDDCDVTREKPGPRKAPDLSLIGLKDSLFCWVSKNWPPGGSGGGKSWLTCDDGSGEIADFVHVDLSKATPVVTLIHVKGSHSDTANRGVSTSAYEVVASQALKNLRFLDQSNLATRLAEHPDRPTWKGGKKVTSRALLLKELAKVSSAFERRVVILQPSLTKREYDRLKASAKKATGSEGLARLRQLNTLMVSTAAECQQLGAKLEVLASV